MLYLCDSIYEEVKMIIVNKTGLFNAWLENLKDRQAYARIVARIDRMADGNFGSFRNFQGGISELKINYGPGYRIYYCQEGDVVYLLLCGGTKKTQQNDIELAREMRKCLLKKN